MYFALGNPSLPGKPYLWRVHNDPDFAAAASADSLSAAVQANPTAPGFVQLGRSFFAARQYEQAAAAYRRAVQMGARDAVTWSELGEAVVMTSGGAVVPEAMTAFANAIAAEPKSERSRFYLGLAEAQIGEMRKAVAIWKDLEKTSPQDAPWLPMLREHITAFAKQGGFDPASVPATPPDPQAMGTAMTAMSRAMQTVPAGHPPVSSSAQSSSGPLPNEPVRDPGVIAMVQRLADKMEKSPTDAAGWQRLAHAYVVIGEADKGLAAAERATRLKPEDAGILMTLAEAQKAKSPNEEVPMGYVTTMRKVLKLEPANTDALYAVGIAEAQAGHSVEARAALTKAQAGMSGDDPRMADIKARLAKIK
jgi:cytochrome c-type biogenesis protein CcmH